MSVEADVAAIRTRLDYMEAHLERIDDRLAAGDKRFEADAIREAGEVATRRLALKVGMWALGVASAIGMWLMAQAPALLKWLSARI